MINDHHNNFLSICNVNNNVMYDILHVAYLPKGKYLSVGICYKQKVVSQAACPSNCYPVLVLAQLCVVLL